MSGSQSGGVRPARLKATGWGWRYGTRKNWAVRGIDLVIEPGERVLLLGASGSGKSTLLHGFAGVLGGADEGETHGSILIDGVPAPQAHGRCGLVLQDPESQMILDRIGDDVAFGCENLGVPAAEIWPRVNAALEDVGLDVALERSTSALSGGQKQRVALAGVLAMQPGALLLDEPTANLDPVGAAEIRDAVARTIAKTGATLVIIEHRTEAWLGLVDRVVVLGAGIDGATEVISDCSPQELLADTGRARALAEQGIWLPGFPPPWPNSPTQAPGTALLTIDQIQISRSQSAPTIGPIRGEICAGEAVGITGTNGSGKTTLGLTLAGLIPPHSGQVVAADTLRVGQKPYPISWPSKALLTRVGMVLQSPDHQLLSHTVREEIEQGPRALGLPAPRIKQRSDELLERLDLVDLAAANPHTLSGGQKRRLTVGAVLAAAPQVLILDEPTFGQDAKTWAELVALLAEIRDSGTAVVAISHDLDVLKALQARTMWAGGS